MDCARRFFEGLFINVSRYNLPVAAIEFFQKLEANASDIGMRWLCEPNE